jgi:hypothetical protein
MLSAVNWVRKVPCSLLDCVSLSVAGTELPFADGYPHGRVVRPNNATYYIGCWLPFCSSINVRHSSLCAHRVTLSGCATAPMNDIHEVNWTPLASQARPMQKNLAMAMLIMCTE